MTLKLVRPVTFSGRRYLSGRSHYTAKEIKIPVPWGHIAGNRFYALAFEEVLSNEASFGG